MTGVRHRVTPEEAAELVHRIQAGDADAWTELVDGFLGLLTATLSGLRLGESDVRDITQTTWLRLVQNIDRIDDPSRVGSWLVTTARREALRVIAQRRWVELSFDGEGPDCVDLGSLDLAQRIVAEERDEVIRDIFDRLPPRCRELLSQLLADPRPAYEDIARSLVMPIGSIGPTRGRCLKKFCELAEECGVDLRELALT